MGQIRKPWLKKEEKLARTTYLKRDSQNEGKKNRGNPKTQAILAKKNAMLSPVLLVLYSKITSRAVWIPCIACKRFSHEESTDDPFSFA